jgi:diadenosine tetraphosphate (Ap4A) HIT family hydrolase
MPLPKKCPFCNVDSARLLRQSGLAIALTDAFPVSLGHALIVPRRHIQSWFESTDDERQEMFTLLDEIRAEILKAHSPPAFNIGINDGPAAGQTVPHLHIHLIPRYTGDSPDPRGGIRWVLPGQADYWNERG